MEPDGAWGQTAKKIQFEYGQIIHPPLGFEWFNHGEIMKMDENGMLMANDLNICLVVEPPTPLKNDGVGQMG